MIALGWTKSKRTPPGVITCKGDGPIRILCAPPCSAISAHDRLTQQVRCFEAGLDFLPIAPLQSIPLRDATGFLSDARLSPLLDRLASKGQLTISLKLPMDKRRPVTGGRHWLIARKAHRDLCNEYEDILLGIANATDLPQSPVRRTAEAVQCDILVDRSTAHTLKARLMADLPARQELSQKDVLITGLWPAFGFADLPVMGTIAA
ncbi:MAG: hypothetical protein AAFP85_05810 [Pseudomonadota bacterium]